MILTFEDVTFNFRCGCTSNKVVFINGYRLCPNCYEHHTPLTSQINIRTANYQYACRNCGNSVTRTTRWAPEHLLCPLCRRKASNNTTTKHSAEVVKCLKPKSKKHKCLCPMCRKVHIYSGRKTWATKIKWQYCPICQPQVDELGDTEGYETDGRVSTLTGKAQTLTRRIA